MGIETATIVVADVVSSTAQRIAVGEERADALRRDIDEALGTAVSSGGGTVVKYLGDGVLALFRSASDAVAVAVEMQRAVWRLGSGPTSGPALRVGLSAGDVSVEDGDCFGTPVVEASRLCSVADPGEVRCADIVRALARGRGGHDFEARGGVELKGLPGPVESWAVPWEPSEDGGDALRQRSPHVGRRRELALLREALEAAARGQGSTVLVAGEPGIGKSRLVTEACREGGADVLWGGCHDGDGLPGAPFVEALTSWAREVDSDHLAGALGDSGPVLATLAPALTARVPGLEPAPPVAGDVALARLQDAVCQWVLRLAASAPVVLVVDDLHWADDVTVRLFRAVARVARDQRVLVVGTYRDTDLDRSHPFAEALPVIRREVEPVRMSLDGLAVEDVSDLLGRMAGHEVPAAFAELLTDQCDGNPFFIRETILHLAEEGRIARRDGQWVATTDDLAIPEGVREVLGRRLARLSAQANALLAVGALFEVSFPLPVACDVTGIGEDQALDAIDEAIAAQVVRPTDVFDHYEFTHALFRHTLVAEMNPSRQVRTHRALAEAMEKRLHGDGTPEEASALARHYARSAALPGGERGVPHALRAAQHAEAGAAFREAYELYAIARELLEPERRSSLQRAVARAAVLAQLPLDRQVSEVTAAGELVALEEGPDAAAEAVAELALHSAELDEFTTTWRLAEVGRRWLDPHRRDRTWVRLRTWELDEQDWRAPGGTGLQSDSPERREVFDAFWSDPDQSLAGLMVGGPARSVLDRRLERPADPGTEILLLILAARRPRRTVEVALSELDAAITTGRIGAAIGFCAFGARGSLVLGDVDGADALLARGLGLSPRISERSIQTFHLMATLAFRGWICGDPLRTEEAGIRNEAVEDPNTKWAGVALVAGTAYTQAWADGDPKALATVETLLPVLESAAFFAPNYPLILHFAIGTHWWLERTDHLDVLAGFLEEKVLQPDTRYLETDGRWMAARIASLSGDFATARRRFDEARAELAAEGMDGLLVAVEYDAARAEVRAGGQADEVRLRAAERRVSELAAHPSMAPWLDRLDGLLHP